MQHGKSLHKGSIKWWTPAVLLCYYFCIFRPQLAASHHSMPPQEPAAPAAVPPGTLPPLQSDHVHHHLPQTLPPPWHGAGRRAPQVRTPPPPRFRSRTLTTQCRNFPLVLGELLSAHFPDRLFLFSVPFEGQRWVSWPTAAPVAAFGPLTSRDDAASSSPPHTGAAKRLFPERWRLIVCVHLGGRRALRFTDGVKENRAKEVWRVARRFKAETLTSGIFLNPNDWEGSKSLCVLGGRSHNTVCE